MTQAQELEPLYVLAVHMLGSRDAAFVAVSDVIGAHPGEPTAWLGALLARLIADEKPARVDRFSELDDILSSVAGAGSGCRVHPSRQLRWSSERSTFRVPAARTERTQRVHRGERVGVSRRARRQ